MKEILIEVLKPFKYSPNGWDNALSILGEELYLDERVAKGLMGMNPPLVAEVDENFKPTVFSSDAEFVEKVVNKEIEDEEADIPVEILLKDEVVLESLIEQVKNAEDGFDELTLGLEYKVVQKSGKWYDVFKVGGDVKLNKKGIARDKVAEYVYNLYTAEV